MNWFSISLAFTLPGIPVNRILAKNLNQPTTIFRFLTCFSALGENPSEVNSSADIPYISLYHYLSYQRSHRDDEAYRFD